MQNISITSTFRFAHEVQIDSEILVEEYGQLKAVKVKDTSIVTVQGYYIIPLFFLISSNLLVEITFCKFGKYYQKRGYSF